MRAALVVGPGVLEIATVPDPIPADDDAVVEVEWCGICGTDLHVLDGDYPAVSYPVIPGHEFSGTVVAVGRRVEALAIGTRVAVDPMVYCGACAECRRGATNLCRRGGGLGTTSDGALAQFIAVRASQCEPIPSSMPPTWGPLIEPLACVVHALDRIGTVLGAHTLVIGAGAAGLLLIGALNTSGALVEVLERTPARRDLAKQFGALDATARFEELPGADDGWDLVVDASGNPEAIAGGLAHLRRGGRLCVFGVTTTAASVAFSPFDVFSRELSIIGTTSVCGTFGRASSLLASASFPADELVSEPLPLDDAAVALERTRQGSVVKSRVAPNAPATSASRDA